MYDHWVYVTMCNVKVSVEDLKCTLNSIRERSKKTITLHEI